MTKNLPIGVVALALILAPVALANGKGASSAPPGEEGAKAALDSSPRHHEWIDVALPGEEGKVVTFVAYPERSDKAPVVVVIQEIFGLTDWLRAVADRLAAEGFLAVAPDLLSGKGPNGAGTDGFPDRDAVVKAVRELTEPEVVARLNAVSAWAGSQPSATDRLATVGFCWGGSQSFHYAAVQPKLTTAVVYYGTAPDSAAMAAINAPIVGFYGGDDARVTSTVAATAATMKQLGKVYVHHVYEGAGHGFLRAQSERDGANAKAAGQAWAATIAHLKKSLE